jgi:hypothetical protein
MALLGDLVLQTANAPGTATFNLIVSPAGRQSFIAGCGAGKTFYYAHDGTNWEVGIGTVAAGSPDTLSRDTVLTNSLGTTVKINFTSTTNVSNDIPAARSLYADENAVYQAQGRRIAALGQATGQTDAARLDQVGWQRIGTADSAAVGLAAVAFTLPTAYTWFCLEWNGLSGGSGAGTLYAEVSTNNGVSFDNTSTSYNWLTNTTTTLASQTYATGTLGFIPLGPPSGTQTNSGFLKFSAALHQGFFENTANTSTSLSKIIGSAYYIPSSAPTNLLIGLNPSFTGGTVRLLGWQS